MDTLVWCLKYILFSVFVSTCRLITVTAIGQCFNGVVLLSFKYIYTVSLLHNTIVYVLYMRSKFPESQNHSYVSKLSQSRIYISTSSSSSCLIPCFWSLCAGQVLHKQILIHLQSAHGQRRSPILIKQLILPALTQFFKLLSTLFCGH